MQPPHWSFILMIPLLGLWMKLSEARIKLRKNNKAVYCGACLGLVDEAEWQIQKVDPKKTVQVGSFRVDPQGNQKLYQIPLARSELHLTEMLESVCSAMNEFAESYDRNARRTTYMRTSSRDGGAISLENIQITGDIHQQLKFACETLVEEYEEELIKMLKEEQNNVKEKFCVEITDMCNTRNVTDFTTKITHATMKAALEAEADDDTMTSPEEDDDDTVTSPDEDDDDSEDSDYETDDDFREEL